MTYDELNTGYTQGEGKALAAMIVGLQPDQVAAYMVIVVPDDDTYDLRTASNLDHEAQLILLTKTIGGILERQHPGQVP